VFAKNVKVMCNIYAFGGCCQIVMCCGKCGGLVCWEPLRLTPYSNSACEGSGNMFKYVSYDCYGRQQLLRMCACDLLRLVCDRRGHIL